MKKLYIFMLVIILSLGSMASIVAASPEPDRYQPHRPLGLYDAINGSRVGVLSPQTVTVIERHCSRWIKINTWRGPMWLDLEFMPPVEELNNLLSRFGNNISVYYRNIDHDFAYRYNAGRVYFGASVSKAVLALMIYQMAERDEVSLDTLLTFESRHQNWGSGIIQRNYPVGTRFTLRRLLELNLVVSDNVATLILRDFIGGEVNGLRQYRDFVTGIGGNPDLARSRIMDSSLTANQAGIFAMAIHEYLVSGGRYSEEFRQHLLGNQFPFLTLQVDVHPPTASKTGWSGPHTVWHDMTIVYADSPFILAVLSTGRAATSTGNQRDRNDFELIYRTFLEWNNYWFPTGPPLPEPIAPVQIIELENIVYINGTPIETAISPVSIDGTVFFPLRCIARELGANLGWCANTQTVTVSTNYATALLQIGNAEIRIVSSDEAERVYILDAPPVIANGNTLVPNCVFYVLFGADVCLDGYCMS